MIGMMIGLGALVVLRICIVVIDKLIKEEHHEDI